MDARTAGAVNPTVDETIPAEKPIEGCKMRLKRWYSPPERVKEELSSLYDRAPHNAIKPPINQSIKRENID